MERLRCISCGAYITIGDGSVKFPCPECDEIIGRCTRCRDLSKKFVSKCGFVGP
ncbi:MAG: zinc finger domain-containing protein [Methanobacteriota archaeon]